MNLVHFQDKPFNITVIQVDAQPLRSKKLKLNDSMKTYKTPRTNTQKIYPFHCRRLNGKVGSQEMPGVTGKFGLGVQSEAGQRLTEFFLPRERTGQSKHPLPTTQEKTLHMDITRWLRPKSD